jgi:hypothetical protein
MASAVHNGCTRRAVICSGAVGVTNEGLNSGCDGALSVQEVLRVREPWICVIRGLAIRRLVSCQVSMAPHVCLQRFRGSVVWSEEEAWKLEHL